MTTPKRRNTADEAIQTLDQLFICHINEGDADALVESFYAEEALLLPPNHPTVVGRTRIRDFWLGLLEAGLGGLSLDSAERWASRNLAYATGAYTLAIRRKVGGTRPP
ncbi:MAG: hypothetical protein E6J42_07270 [Chloroflexi bacterium]|nr:MAG: hypothetical protein E6J42_07270 [Chloroflexota bacterium]